MPQIVPFVPNDAPFSKEQRAWLNGFLAGVFSSAPAPAVAVKAEPLKIAVFYASQTGTAEGLARKLTKELKLKGYSASAISLEAYTSAALADERYAIFIVSTYGQGDAPDAVQPFYEQVCVEHFPRYENLQYAVFALGDRHYETFCKFGIDLDNKLATLGANRICERVECDVDIDAPFARWRQELFKRFEAIAAAPVTESNVPALNLDQVASASTRAPAEVTAPAATPTPTASASPSRDNPFFSTLVEKRSLTRNGSSKSTLHLTWSIADSGIRYDAGDACGIIPHNDPALVEDILRALHFSGEEPVEIPKAGTLPLKVALRHHLVVTKLSRKMIERYATTGRCKTLLSLLATEQQEHLEKYVYERGLVDLLEECPGVIHDAADLVAILPKLTPRLYSISSSPSTHLGEVHTTIAVVRYRSLNRERGGVCSTLVADRVPVGERVPIYIQPNKKFRLPQNPDTPVIMIGPGTGIAPFRAFLHERRVIGAKGRNWLFFGERNSANDYLYRDELEGMLADGHLTRLDTAFSRDQQHKVYVQDRMLEQAPQFWAWLQDGAGIYVCGDASRMAKDVDTTLHAIIEKQGGMSHESAKEYVRNLKDEHRYHRDVY
ncbi:sulfite reductase subunit alpha [Alloacidobacterium dinghuense]|uniref:assimilatory sulfite reductase (NADPH) n=1 Tax=Alloacidobacterium dinghuense TaxID=2763107 RepID=A0A7G8BHP6_9BACT|nr:sulfite reductase subunit alpha [Alloacidobacterium dinghuense]QNI32066.1 sulfite reductase subunit alpha [Alloacidobacterium dinghuense]